MSELDAVIPEFTAPKKAVKAVKSSGDLMADAPRVRIVLEENDEVPPTGLFLSVNGRGYVLRASEEADVPDFLLEVLDRAVVEVPRTEGDRVVGYKKRSRFPYRIIK